MIKKFALVVVFLLITSAYPHGGDMSVTALYLRAGEFERIGDFQSAHETYSKILSQEQSATIYLKLADLDIRMGNLDTAHKHLMSARILSPNDPEITFRIGVYCAERADMTSDGTEQEKWLKLALNSFQTAAKADPTEKHLVAVALTAINLKDYKLAMSVYNKLINELQLAEYQRHRGVLYLETGQKRKGIADLKAAAARDDVQAIIRLADIAIQENDSKSAEKYLTRASELSPNLALPDIYLGEIYKNQKNYKKAIHFYMQAADNMQGRMKITLLKQAAGLAIAEGDYQTALKAYTAAIQNDKSDPQLFYLAGQTAAFLKEHQKAWEIYQEGLILYPDYAMMRKRAGFSLLMLSKPEKAAEVVGEIDVLERDLEYYFILADAYSSVPNRDKAIAVLSEGIKDYPDNLQLHIALAFQYERLKKYDETIAILKHAVQIDPNSATVQNFLGYIYADLNINLDEAEKLINKALAQDPDNYAYIDSKAWVEFRKGNYENALKYINKALEKAPDDEEVLEHKTQILKALEYKKGSNK